MSVNIPKSAGEERINRALRTTSAVVAAVAIIGTGAYLISRLPKARPIDTAPALGPRDSLAARQSSAAALPAIPLRDVAAASGLTFTRSNGARGEKLLPETMGGGVGVLDADNDGDQDIVLIDGHSTTRSTVRLFRNDTAAPDASRATSMQFIELAQCGLACDIDGMGLAVGDFNGDGRADLYVTGVGANTLFRNDSTETEIRFVDVTKESGADPVAEHSRWATSAGFFDADRDGDLDLLVCNYVQWSREIDLSVNYTLAGVGRAYGPPTGFAGDDLLYLRNSGDGTFADATQDAGFTVRNAQGLPIGKALGLVFIDPDHDGDLDVVVANDTVAKGFFVNDGRGHFQNQAAECGIAFDQNGAPTGAMGIDAAFLRSVGHGENNDLAIAIGNFANEPDSLLVSRSESTAFSDDAIIEGLAAPTRAVLTFGLLFVDIDLDGDVDLAQANGHIEDQINRVQPSQTYAQRGQLFINRGVTAPCFLELPPQSIGDLATPRVGRGLSYADFDQDGDLDLVLAQVAGPVALLRNDQALQHHWLRIVLRGAAPNTGAIGAEIELSSGGKTQRRLVSATRSYLSQSELPCSFGLGGASQVERLQVRWPSGVTQVIPVGSVDQTITITESAGAAR